MTSHEGDNGEKGSYMPNMIDTASTVLSRYSRLTNKPKQKYGLFAEL